MLSRTSNVLRGLSKTSGVFTKVCLPGYDVMVVALYALEALAARRCSFPITIFIHLNAAKTINDRILLVQISA